MQIDSTLCSHSRPGELQVPFGLSEVNGRLYEPRQVPMGKACGCVCPGCRTQLIAIHAPSGKVVPHFKHEAAVECTTGFETALHLAAKQLIEDELKLWFPVLLEDFFVFDALGIEHKSTGRICREGLDVLTAVAVEPWLNSIRPDILATTMLHNEVLVEIAVTHKVGPEKLAKIKARNLATLEVVLSDLQPVNLSVLADALFKPSERTRWLHHPQLALRERAFKERMRPILQKAKQEALEQAAHDKALAEAEATARLKKKAEEDATRATIDQHNEAFRILSVSEKQQATEKKIGAPMSAWPLVTKVKNKLHAAILEPCTLWQGAVYFQFFMPEQFSKSVKPWAIRNWLEARFNIADNEAVDQAVRYFLAVLKNKGLVRLVSRDLVEVLPEGGALSVPARQVPPLTAGAAFPQYKPRIFTWNTESTINPKQLDELAEAFCDNKRFSILKLRQLLGAPRLRIIEDYASPRLAAAALMRQLGGEDHIWLSFLCLTGLAKES